MDVKNKEVSKGGQTLGFKIPSPVREKAPLPTPEEIKAANSGAYAPSTRKVEKIGRNRLLKAAIGGGVIVGAGAIAYEAVPAVHRLVDSAFLDNIKDKLFGSTEASISETVFDPTATKGTIKPSMIVRLPQEEIDRQFPNAFGKLGKEEDKTITSLAQPAPLSEEAAAERVGKLFPDLLFEVGPDKNTLQFQYPLDLRSSSNPNAQIQFTKSYGAFTQTDRDAFKDQGYYDTYRFMSIPQGTIIRAPVDGFLVIDKSEGITYHNNPDESAGGFIDFHDPNGTIYRLIILGEKGNNIFVLKSLLDAPPFDYAEHKKPIDSYGMPVKKGQELFQTNSKLDEVVLKIMGAIKYKEGKMIYVPTNVELFNSSDNQLIASRE